LKKLTRKGVYILLFSRERRGGEWEEAGAAAQETQFPGNRIKLTVFFFFLCLSSLVLPKI